MVDQDGVGPGITGGDDLGDDEVALLGAMSDLEPTDGRVAIDGPLATIDVRTLFDDQVTSRCLDHSARWLRSMGRGYYTIGSSGHESNAVIAAMVRPTDPALLHYRSGGFYLARARQAGCTDAIDHVLLGVMAATSEPGSGGRHKVFGHPDLAVIPQTSTIGSHLPRALGVAFAIARAERLGVDLRWPPGSIAVCSFGDASVNHSTGQGALNAISYTAHQGLPVPLLLVCEDNGLGISVPTPVDWVEMSVAHRPHLRYEQVDGSDPAAVAHVTSELAGAARDGQPAFLHLRTVRYGGHAATDIEVAYRKPEEIRADRARDPILAVARVLVEAGQIEGADLAERYRRIRADLAERAAELVGGARGLESAEEIMEPLAPRRPHAVADRVARLDSTRSKVGSGSGSGSTLAEAINRTLADLLEAEPKILLFGEDVGRKGGVYGVTRGLQKRFGAARVFDSMLDEQSILGLALGCAVSGFVPIPEMQYLAYLHSAEDQLRGEAATLSFFSNGAFRNGMVVRIAGFADPRGFGGHFHNDSSIAVLRDIPGLVIACPSGPDEASALLRTCVGAALEDGTVSVYIEPIARYRSPSHSPPPAKSPTGGHVPIGESAVVREGGDVVVVTFGNGVHSSLDAADRLEHEDGISCRVIDLRWLAPLDHDAIARHGGDVGRMVVVDETRRTGGVAEGVVSGMVDRDVRARLCIVAGRDSLVPLGPASERVLVTADDVTSAVRRLFSREA
ncbi:MAG TPA: thiamine pyrophosphate-dependent enzyme [Acidimicrobiales bacterium]|jgi:2-oxoisovalerate dehydrogenase E1 component